jgi:hypothetical protein
MCQHDAHSAIRSDVRGEELRIAITDLKLDRLFVVYAGTARIPLTDKIECLPFTEIAAEVSA